MKAILIISIVTALSFAQNLQDLNDGRYYPNVEGQYKPDNSGEYYGGDDGSYRADNSGRYVGDDSGNYRGTFEKYVHTADQVGGRGSSGSGGGGKGGSDGTRGGGYVEGKTGVLVAVQPVRNSRNRIGTLTGNEIGSTSGTLLRNQLASLSGNSLDSPSETRRTSSVSRNSYNSLTGSDASSSAGSLTESRDSSSSGKSLGTLNDSASGILTGSRSSSASGNSYGSLSGKSTSFSGNRVSSGSGSSYGSRTTNSALSLLAGGPTGSKVSLISGSDTSTESKISLAPGNTYGILSRSGSGVATGRFGGGSGVYNTVVVKQGSDNNNYNKGNYAIIRKVEQVGEDGYHYLYETENKILGEEQGKLANIGTENEAMSANGYFEYTGPNNVVYRVEYTANENGFVPSAAHIPTPPPIPEAILRSLEYQRSIGEL